MTSTLFSERSFTAILYAACSGLLRCRSATSPERLSYSSYFPGMEGGSDDWGLVSVINYWRTVMYTRLLTLSSSESCLFTSWLTRSSVMLYAVCANGKEMDFRNDRNKFTTKQDKQVSVGMKSFICILDISGSILGQVTSLMTWVWYFSIYTDDWLDTINERVVVASFLLTTLDNLPQWIDSIIDARVGAQSSKLIFPVFLPESAGTLSWLSFLLF